MFRKEQFIHRCRIDIHECVVAGEERDIILKGKFETWLFYLSNYETNELLMAFVTEGNEDASMNKLDKN